MNSSLSTQSEPHVRRLEGVFPALPTPFTQDGRLDHNALERIVEHVIEGGVHGLWALGSGSEFPALTLADRASVLQGISKANRGRLPILAGVSDTSLHVAIANAQQAASIGADAVFALPPYYYFYAHADIQRFFEMLASASPLPVVIYNNPFNSKIKLDMRTIHDLSLHENIVGIKDTSCEWQFHRDLLAAFGDNDAFFVFQGYEPLIPDSLLEGSSGIVAAAPNIAPRLVVRLWEAARAGNIEQVRQLESQLKDLLEIFCSPDGLDDSHFLAGQKAALELLGLCTRFPAPPCQPFSDERLEKVRQILCRNGLLPVDERPHAM